MDAGDREDGVFRQKLRPLDCPSTSGRILKRWRQSWQDHCNELLSEYTLDAHIDCRSLATRGITRPPRQHLGPEQSHRRRRGYSTAGGRHNAKVDEIESADLELARLNRQIRHALTNRRRTRVQKQITKARKRSRRAAHQLTAMLLTENTPDRSLPGSPRTHRESSKAALKKTSRRR